MGVHVILERVLAGFFIGGLASFGVLVGGLGLRLSGLGLMKGGFVCRGSGLFSS